jgi:hypothetical protein
MKVLDFISEYWMYLSPIIYELIVRLLPTQKNYSMLDLTFEVLNKTVPNIRKNKVVKLVVILALAGVTSSFAQINTTSKGFFSTNVTDTASVKNTRTSLQSSNGNTGGLYFDKTRNKWRVWNGTTWIDLINEDTGPAYGLVTQIPYTNVTEDDFDYSENLTFDNTLNNFRAADNVTDTNTGTTDNNTTLGIDHTFSGAGNIRWHITTGENNTTNVTNSGRVIHNSGVHGVSNTMTNTGASSHMFNDYILGGALNTAEVNSAMNMTGSSILNGRSNTISNSSMSLAAGMRAKVTGWGSFAFGYPTTFDGNASYTGTIQEVLAGGKHSINMSANSAASIVGQGANADYSAIIAGYDHDIPSTSPQSVIIGGSGIKARANDPNQVYLPGLNITSTTTVTNDSIVDFPILSSTGIVYRSRRPFISRDNRSVSIQPIKGTGTITVTNGSAVVTGTGTNFSDATFGSGMSFWLNCWFKDASNNWYRCSSITVNTATQFTATTWYDQTAINSGYTIGTASTFAGTSGTYEFYLTTTQTDNYGVALGTNSVANNYSYAFGGNTVATGTNSFCMGNSAAATGTRSIVFGNVVLSSGTNSFAGGIGTVSGGTDRRLLASGARSFNWSENNTSQTVGHGAAAANCAILGGVNHDIPSTSPRSVIIGGSAIKARASAADQVYVPTLNINTTPTTDNTSGSTLLARDNSTGEIKLKTNAITGTLNTSTAPAYRIALQSGTSSITDNGDFVINTTDRSLRINASTLTTGSVVGFGTTFSYTTAGSTSGNATDLILGTGAGATSSGNGDGGDITLDPGAGGGTGHRGYIIFNNLPTSAAGLPTGALWNNAGVLSIAP